MNQKNNKFKIILGITLILAIIICSFIVENCNNNKKYTDVNLDSSKLNIFYFNVGQADCTLVTINNKNLLIDAGNKSDGEYIVEFLKEKKLNNIDYFIITHGDMDHRGGAEIILNNCNVGQIFMPEGLNEAEEKCKKIWKYMLLGDNKEAQKYFIEDISKHKKEELLQALEETIENIYDVDYNNEVQKDTKNFAKSIKEYLNKEAEEYNF